jgi:hypothetical protein
MLRSSNFWFGAAAGIGALYAWKMYQAKKMQKGS